MIAVDAPETLAAVKAALSRGNYWAAPSPLIVAFATRADLDCQIPDGREYALFGCGLAAMNLMIQATEIGLIAHPIAGYRQAEVKAALGVPEDYTIITLVIIGHPANDMSGLSEKHQAAEVSQRDRRPIESVVAWNGFDLGDREML